jgi:alkylation response protein AidB-like acyl-CoA dehydrogenase
MTDRGPRIGAGGTPVLRVCMLPADDVAVLDNWDTTGLRGSGSNDVVVSDVFVPAERTWTFGQAPMREGALYRYPFMFVVNMPGVPLGIAGGALDDFVALAKRKRLGGAGGPTLAEAGSIQLLAADATITLQLTRGGVRDLVSNMWATLESGGDVRPEGLRLFAAINGAFRMCGQVVESVYQAGGRDALFKQGSLERRFRDMFAARQHIVGSVTLREAIGRSVLGQPSGVPFF